MKTMSMMTLHQNHVRYAPHSARTARDEARPSHMATTMSSSKAISRGIATPQ